MSRAGQSLDRSKRCGGPESARLCTRMALSGRVVTEGRRSEKKNSEVDHGSPQNSTSDSSPFFRGRQVVGRFSR